jgi:hypothetical protein
MKKHLLLLTAILFLPFITIAQLSGTKQVGGSGADFATLADAAVAINTQGISGNLILKVSSGTYTQRASFSYSAGSLTIESLSGNASDVLFSAPDQTENEDYQLEFINSSQLTIRNISFITTGFEFGTGMLFRGICENIEIDNISFTGNRNDPGISLATPESGFFGGSAKNVSIHDSYFTTCSYSIQTNQFSGESENIQIRNNTFFDANAVSLYNVIGLVCENNLMQGDVYQVKAIQLLLCTGNVFVNANKMYKCLRGIEVNACDGTVNNPILFTNNFIEGKKDLINAYGNSNLLLAHNSFSASGEDILAQISGNESGFIMRNNIFASSHLNGLIYSFNTSFDVDSDYNSYYAVGNIAEVFDLQTSELVPIPTFSDLQELTIFENNSIGVNPVFVNQTNDLHATNSVLNAGTPLAQVTMDIDGELRSPINPSIGADEMGGIPITPNITLENVAITSATYIEGSDAIVTWSGINQFTQAYLAPWTDRIYMSSDNVLSADDTLLYSYIVSENLAAGAEYQRSQVISLPIYETGTRFIIVRINALGNVNENNADNIRASQSFVVLEMAKPQLEVSAYQLPQNVQSGTTLMVGWDLTNTGEVTASGLWKDALFISSSKEDLSDETFLISENASLAYTSNPIALLAGEAYSSQKSVQVPTVFSGYLYVKIIPDFLNSVYEQDENITSGLIDSVLVFQSPLADLVIENLVVPETSFSGENIDITYTVKNVGTAATSPVPLPANFYYGSLWAPLFGDWIDYILFRENQLTSNSLSYFRVESYDGPDIEPGESYTRTITAQVPGCIEGPRFIHVITDRRDNVVELTNSNNLLISDTLQVVMRPNADLIVINPVLDNSDWTTGTSNFITYTLRNQGADTVKTTFKDKFYWSLNADASIGQSEHLSTVSRNIILAPDEEQELNATVIIPLGQGGNGVFSIHTDGNNDICEKPFENNNLLQINRTVIESPAADLDVSSIDLSSNSFVAGDALNFVATIENYGDAPAEMIWWDALMLIPETPNAAPAFQELRNKNMSLANGLNYSISDPLNIPLSLNAGSYRLAIKADSLDQIWELNREENNLGYSEIIEISRDSNRVADLTIQSHSIGSDFISGADNTINMVIKNRRSPIETGTWKDAVLLLNLAGDTLAMRSTLVSQQLATDNTYTTSLNLSIPNGISGEHMLVMHCNSEATVLEYNLTNNSVRIPINIGQGTPSDLAPQTFNIPSTINAGQPISINLNVQNTGNGSIQNKTWIDRIILSQNSQVNDGNDYVIWSNVNENQSLAPQASYTINVSPVIPLSFSGTYFVIFQSDKQNTIFESNENNNLIISSPIQIIIPPPVDFTVSGGTINALEFATLLNYTLENTSNNAFTGQFQNRYFLSEDENWSTDDRHFGTELVQFQAAFEGGSNVDRLTSMTDIPIVAGDYYIVQKIDAFNQVHESNEFNNEFILGPFFIDNIEELFSDVEKPGILEGYFNPEKHYKIAIPDGFGMVVEMKQDSVPLLGFSNENEKAIYELYVAEERLAAANDHDFRFNSPLQNEQHVMVATGPVRTDYIMASAPYIHPTLWDSIPRTHYNITASLKSFSLYDVQPAIIGNAHNSTLRISGFDLWDESNSVIPQIALFNGQDTVYAYEVYPQNSLEVVAYVDMRDVNPGVFRILYIKPGGTSTTSEFTVELIGGGKAEVSLQVDVPGAVRRNNEFLATVTYGNTGYTNEYDLLLAVGLYMEDGLPADFEVSCFGGSANPFFPIDSVPNPFGIENIYHTDSAAIYFVHIPILFNQYQQTLHFKVKGDIVGRLTTEAVIVRLPQSDFTYSGRMEHADRSYWITLVDQAIAAIPGVIDDISGITRQTLSCDKILDADLMTARLAKQTVDVAKRALGSKTFIDDVKGAFSKLTGQAQQNYIAEVYDRAKAFKTISDAKGTIDLTNENVEFSTELNDVFSCLPTSPTISPADGGPCNKIYSYSVDGVQYKVPVDDCKKKDREPNGTDIQESNDPNEIVGPAGLGVARLVDNEEVLEYTIYFENKSIASANAARVKIINPLHESLNPASFRLKAFGIGDTVIILNPTASVQQTIPLGPKWNNQNLRLVAGVDVINATSFWEFNTIDPNTSNPQDDPSLGFLPPNDSVGSGEGFVTYQIRLKPELSAGSRIPNQADIIFDYNEVIPTNTWENHLKGGNIQATVLNLPEFSPSGFSLKWQNTSPPFAPDLVAYRVYVMSSTDNVWRTFLPETRATSASFEGTVGETYHFRASGIGIDGLVVDGFDVEAKTTIRDQIDQDSLVNTLNIFPNPYTGDGLIGFTIEEPGSYILSICDINGKTRLNRTVTVLDKSTYYLNPNPEGLTSGFYVVSLWKDKTHVRSQKLVVINRKQ